MECLLEQNRRECTCTYQACTQRGKCCDCVRYHRSRGELPGCFFPPEAEKSYDRSRTAFIRAWQQDATA